MPADLSAKQVAALGPGRHRVSKNLYLAVGFGRNGSGRSWVLLYNSPKTRLPVAMGLGSADLIGVARAKELALRYRLAILEGRDPLEERRAAQPVKTAVLTFRQVAELYIGSHEASWRNAKHRQQWTNTLETYAHPILGDLAVEAVDTGAVMRVIEPIWHTKPETASRVRGRIESVVAYAAARHWRQGDNPARWRGHIENLLPKRARIRPIKHHAALSWQQLPALWAELAGHRDVSALALRLTLLTLLRTNEALGGQWSEITDGVWTVPGQRMKGGREFRVPLVGAAMDVLDELVALRQNNYLFPGARRDRPLSNMAMLEKLRGMRGHGITVHGTVRSGFRDWAGEHGIAREVAETCLAHVNKDKTEAAYLRGDLLVPRRAALERWARFLATASVGGHAVVPLRRS